MQSGLDLQRSNKYLLEKPKFVHLSLFNQKQPWVCLPYKNNNKNMAWF